MLCCAAFLRLSSPHLPFSRAIRSMATRSYREAIDCLNGLQSNQAMIEASRASGGRMVQYAMHETEEYLSRIGYKVCLLRDHIII